MGERERQKETERDEGREREREREEIEKYLKEGLSNAASFWLFRVNVTTKLAVWGEMLVKQSANRKSGFDSCGQK